VSDTHLVVWIDGKRVPSEGAHISARDRGFTLADGVFETMKVHKGRVFRLDQHLARIEGALRTLAIPVPPELREWVDAAVRAAHAPEASIRLTITRGIAPGGVPVPPDPVPTVVVTVGTPPSFGSAVYEAGLTARFASGRRNEHSMSAGLKTLAYLDSVLGLLEARRNGADEALFLDTEGHCAEASASNFFAVIDGELATPPIGCAALPGITRAAVIELAAGLGLAVNDRPLDPARLKFATEAFLTSSLRGIAPLVRLDGVPVGTGAPGGVTRTVMAAYNALVTRECSV
jgi:branched-chain amino acid aminotransferase